jgi:hypothetical protein
MGNRSIYNIGSISKINKVGNSGLWCNISRRTRLTRSLPFSSGWTGDCPVTNSSNTTPKMYMSHFSVTFMVNAYSVIEKIKNEHQSNMERNYLILNGKLQKTNFIPGGWCDVVFELLEKSINFASPKSPTWASISSSNRLLQSACKYLSPSAAPRAIRYRAPQSSAVTVSPLLPPCSISPLLEWH